VVICLVAPEQLGWVALRVPAGWRWFGTGLGLMGILLLIPAHHALGKNLAAPGVMQDTYLNVRGEVALLNVVQRCWASLWMPRALDYWRGRASIHWL
jgi:hypothetical protein